MPSYPKPKPFQPSVNRETPKTTFAKKAKKLTKKATKKP